MGGTGTATATGRRAGESSMNKYLDFDRIVLQTQRDEPTTELYMLESRINLCDQSISVTFVFDPAISEWLESVRHSRALIATAYSFNYSIVYECHIESITFSDEYGGMIGMTLFLNVHTSKRAAISAAVAL
jgi:hypothetical protein